ncbi:MAG: LptF/LptG family permease [Candidatus Eremiobacteraeota bacterium]|nr:LptF/LptG family permease [Candidatus Eremiobacteraeota bacterium]
MASAARFITITKKPIFRVPIMDAYEFREFIGPFLGAFFAVIFLWGINIFFIALDFLINAHAPPFLVLRFVLFRMPQGIPYAFPFATLFATLLAMGRLSGDNEINAMRTAGISIWRICLTPFLCGIGAFVLAYAMNESIAPLSVEQSTRTFYQIIYHTASLPVEPQFFRKDPDTGNVFFVSQVLPDNKTMQGVQVYKPGRNGYFGEILSAKIAHVEGATLVMNDVIINRFNADGAAVAQIRDSTVRVGLPLGETNAQFMSSTNSDPYTMTSKSLSTQVNSLKAQGVGGAALGSLQISLANKSSFPFACIVAVLIALPLSFRFGKKGRFVGMGLAILTFIVYQLVSLAAAAFGRNGVVNPYIASWTPNMIFGLAGLALLWWEER